MQMTGQPARNVDDGLKTAAELAANLSLLCSRCDDLTITKFEAGTQRINSKRMVY